MTYIMFGIFCLAMFAHTYFMFPETAGKTLEEVEGIFTDPRGPRYIGTPAWKTHNTRKHVLDLERSGSLANEGKMNDDDVAEKQVERTSGGEN